MDIKVIGAGCAECDRLLDETQKVLQYLRMEAALAKVESPDEARAFKARLFPALVINGEVVSEGRVPREGEICSMITTAAMKEG